MVEKILYRAGNWTRKSKPASGSGKRARTAKASEPRQESAFPIAYFFREIQNQRRLQMKTKERFVIVALIALFLSGFFLTEALAQEKTRWKMQGPFPAGMALSWGGTEFVKKVNDASGGRLEIKYFSGGSVVPALQEFDAVNKGTLDAHYSASHYHTSKIGLAGDLFNLLRFRTSFT
jgi:hypothetical protein